MSFVPYQSFLTEEYDQPISWRCRAAAVLVFVVVSGVVGAAVWLAVVPRFDPFYGMLLIAALAPGTAAALSTTVSESRQLRFHGAALFCSLAGLGLWVFAGVGLLASQCQWRNCRSVSDWFWAVVIVGLCAVSAAVFTLPSLIIGVFAGRIAARRRAEHGIKAWRRRRWFAPHMRDQCNR